MYEHVRCRWSNNFHRSPFRTLVPSLTQPTQQAISNKCQTLSNHSNSSMKYATAKDQTSRAKSLSIPPSGDSDAPLPHHGRPVAPELLLAHPGLYVSGDGRDHGASNPSAVLPQPWLRMGYRNSIWKLLMISQDQCVTRI